MPKGHHEKKRGFFGWFNRVFDRSADKYANGVAAFLKHTGIALIFYGIIGAIVVFLFIRKPTGFLPEEDQGVLFAMASLPPGSTREQSNEVLKKMEHHFLVDEKENVEGMFGVLGFSFSGSGQNQVLVFVKLKDWEERKSPGQTVTAIQGRAMGDFLQFKDAFAFAFAPPAVLELGTATGFDVRLVDRGSVGHDGLIAARNQFLGMAMQNPVLTRVRPNGLDDQPEYQINIDQEKASALGLSIADVNSAISTIFGSTYVNDFIDKGRVKKVFMQGDAPFRMEPEDIDRWYLRNPNVTAASPANTGRQRDAELQLLREFQCAGRAKHGAALRDLQRGVAARLAQARALQWPILRRAPRRSCARPQHRRSDERSRKDGAEHCLLAWAWNGPVYLLKKGLPDRKPSRFMAPR